jgi:uncharacterized protein YuzE
MKKILLLLCVSLSSIGLYAQAPTPLYGAEKYGNTLYKMDTTGGGMTVVSTIPMTAPYYIYGTYGLALDPTTDIMYILYENGGPYNRRLGTVDVLTGSITDIGDAGDMADIEFGPDGQLYGTENSWNYTFDFMSINKLTGAQTYLLGHTNSYPGAGICYDPFNDKMLKFDRIDIASINLGTMVETNETPISNPSTDVNASVVYSPTKAMTVRWGSIYSFNTSTKVFSYVGGSPGYFHALAFGKQPCEDLDITVTTTELCEGDDVTLTAVSATGGTISWDGGVVNGVPFAPGVPGEYNYNVTSDSEDDCPADGPVTITVIGLPTVIAGAGDLIFCEDQSITLSAGGDADLYVWNDGAPLDLTPGLGTYTFDLTGYYTEGGCLGENTDEVTVEVVALPTITATVSDTPICLNNEVTFTGGGGSEYDWDNGVTDGVPYTPGSTGIVTYTVYGTDENGCSNMASVDVEVVPGVTISAVATDEILGSDATLDITVSGGAPAYTFDWDNDGTGDFDDTEDLTGLTAGEYTVVVQSEAGCSTTATYRVDGQLGVTELDGASIAVYPNPTQDIVSILSAGNFNFEVIAINGEVLFSGSAVDTKTISLGDFADGVYFVNVTTETTTSTIKVVKK